MRRRESIISLSGLFIDFKAANNTVSRSKLYIYLWKDWVFTQINMVCEVCNHRVEVQSENSSSSPDPFVIRVDL